MIQNSIKWRSFLQKPQNKLAFNGQNSEHIGTYIRLHRLNHHLSQYDLANMLNVSRQAIYAWEKCKRIPSRHHFEELSYILDMPYDQYYPLYLRSKRTPS